MDAGGLQSTHRAGARPGGRGWVADVDGELRQEEAMTPRGLSRPTAAEYVGCSPRKFDQMIQDGLMPAPRLIGTKKIWDRVELDEAFEELPREFQGNSVDAIFSAR